MRFWGMVVFGVAGVTVLIALGVWQVQRLGWKQEVLTEITAKIGDIPQDLPVKPIAVAHTYQPVSVVGTYGKTTLRVLVSRKFYGAGFRLITEFETNGRRILVDRGFIKQDADVPAPPKGVVTLVGNLHWPQEVDGFTPNPDWETGLVFARDVSVLSQRLGSEPVLLIVRSSDPADASVVPLPVSVDGIPNNHLEYALTWFSLSLIWLGMSVYFLYRNR